MPHVVGKREDEGEGQLLPRRPVATAAAVAVVMMVVCDDDMVDVRRT